jgi:class 3 adenylate cyclase
MPRQAQRNATPTREAEARAKPESIGAEVYCARGSRVTVLFADVKGSMELAESVDPEEWHRIMDRFFAILSEGVHRFEGTINQFTGDGIMALEAVEGRATQGRRRPSTRGATSAATPNRRRRS